MEIKSMKAGARGFMNVEELVLPEGFTCDFNPALYESLKAEGWSELEPAVVRGHEIVSGRRRLYHVLNTNLDIKVIPCMSWEGPFHCHSDGPNGPLDEIR